MTVKFEYKTFEDIYRPCTQTVDRHLKYTPSKSEEVSNTFSLLFLLRFIHNTVSDTKIYFNILELKQFVCVFNSWLDKTRVKRDL